MDALNQVVRHTNGKVFSFKDICLQAELKANDGTSLAKCVNSAMPLDFVYEKSSNSYRLDQYNTDQKLLEKVRTGKGDPEIYQGNNFLFLDGFLADTEPTVLTQQSSPNPSSASNELGTNNLERARVTRYSYFIDPGRNTNLSEQAYMGFE